MSKIIASLLMSLALLMGTVAAGAPAVAHDRCGKGNVHTGTVNNVKWKWSPDNKTTNSGRTGCWTWEYRWVHTGGGKGYWKFNPGPGPQQKWFVVLYQRV